MKPFIAAALLSLSTGAFAQQCYQFSERGFSASENFFAWTSNTDVIAQANAQLKKPASERQMIVGKIARGDGGRNTPWSWHFIPDVWTFADFATEVCDAKPSYVEANLDAWLKAPVNFCPWASYVAATCAVTGISLAEPHGVASGQGVTYRLPQEGTALLRILRFDGVAAAEIPQGRVAAGEHEAALPAGLRGGLYVLTLVVDGRTALSRKILLP